MYKFNKRCLTILSLILLIILITFNKDLIENLDSSHEAVQNISSVYNEQEMVLPKTTITQQLHVDKRTYLNGKLDVSKDIHAKGNIHLDKNQTIDGDLLINGSLNLKHKLKVIKVNIPFTKSNHEHIYEVKNNSNPDGFNIDNWTCVIVGQPYLDGDIYTSLNISTKLIKKNNKWMIGMRVKKPGNNLIEKTMFNVTEAAFKNSHNVLYLDVLCIPNNIVEN